MYVKCCKKRGQEKKESRKDARMLFSRFFSQSNSVDVFAVEYQLLQIGGDSIEWGWRVKLCEPDLLRLNDGGGGGQK